MFTQMARYLHVNLPYDPSEKEISGFHPSSLSHRYSVLMNSIDYEI